MPYSVSVPITRRTLMQESLMSLGAKRSRPGVRVTGVAPEASLASAVRTGAIRALGSGVARPGDAHRYWPVFATVSIDRPASVPCLPEISVLM
jgi:hypothetical protein